MPCQAVSGRATQRFSKAGVLRPNTHPDLVHQTFGINSIPEFHYDPNIPSAFTTDHTQLGSSVFFEKMPDPLSITASIAGLLGLSAKVLTTLRDLRNNAKDAPPSISRVIEGVEALHSKLGQVHAMLGQAHAMLRTPFPEHNRLTMINVDHLITTLSGAVLVITKLDRYIGEVADLADASVIKRTWNRVKWASWKEQEIADCVEQLHRHNASLNLMLAIVQW
jgi:hypothetical protein